MIRILHTADVHLDSPLRSLALRDPELRDRVRTSSRTALTRIVDTALAEEVAALLIAGDLFDGAERSARTAAFLTLQLERLRERGIRVFYIKGNHDAENPLTGELSFPDNVHVFDGRGGKVQLAEGVWIHGVSFSNRHAPESLLPRFPAPVEGAVNIALLHTSLTGAEGHDPYAPCTVGDLTAAGFDYWALGHVHRRQVHSKAPWIVMPGTPQGRDIGEPGPKSATLLTIDKAIEIEEVPTSAVEFLHLQMDATDTDNDDALRDMLRRTLRDTARNLVSESAVIRLQLTGRTRRRWQVLRDQDVWKEAAAQYARETGTLWLEKVVFDLSDTAEPGHSATDELAGIMKTIREEPGFSETCRAEIEGILQELAPQRRAELLPDEAAMDQLARRLAEAGADRILARMKGATP
ncbi:metallophosphoesterase family protein [Jannaschia seohaensis]|uniref:DNA repair exonuclease SbcCD nuclease subunit n=1 Tax=Jannaschia seohaensis TaxID=475081 RepID=A0A2Y9B0C0_9RHOB|nr:DNA repair exonuclease [Jannaschia seohaensis]PWJ17620.1 DNA repair exonuclease SbcCD nuclease subunit [Jannaschia seohaensis]SSA47779.1 DNA repair exonuclease SbcCD nuclease subunit [Jannaschia seohaensis]